MLITAYLWDTDYEGRKSQVQRAFLLPSTELKLALATDIVQPLDVAGAIYRNLLKSVLNSVLQLKISVTAFLARTSRVDYTIQSLCPRQSISL